MKQDGNKNIFSLRNSFLRLKRDSSRWSFISLAIVFFIALPVISISVNLWGGPGSSWGHMLQYLLPQYISNSIYLMVTCTLLTLVLGVFSAWLVARYEFPLRRVAEWLLILPLAIPSYITAYAYAGVFDYGGTFTKCLEYFGLTPFRIDIMNRFGLAFVLSVSLFPYVYVSARTFFVNQSGNLLEASKMLGVGELKTFFKMILPLARPAILAGLVLVLMEVLNDYGAATYFGVNTFTTGIFRSWFSLEEPETAIYLSAILLCLVFALLVFEKWQRRNKQFTHSGRGGRSIARKKTSKKVALLILLFVLFPIVLGFIIPLFQLLYWSSFTFYKVFDQSFLSLSLKSLWIALITAFFTVIIATLLIFASRWNRIGFIKNLSKLGVLGYAIPGAVVAIGIMIPTLAIDKWLIQVLNNYFGISSKLLINGTLAALIYAYIVRFLAVAYNPIESASLKVSNAIPDASRTLGIGSLKTFFKIEFPLIKTGLLGAFILVFMDVLKELPLTLILKPYHINTLAVKAYEYASDELIMESAVPSLFIIVTALIPVILLSRFLGIGKQL